MKLFASAMATAANFSALVLVCVIVLLILTTMIVIFSRYRKCPSDKVLVIYGKVGAGSDGSSRSSKCIHGGAAFIWPVIQAYEYMDLTPISISVDLRNALSKQHIRVDVPSRFTVGISTENGVMQNAAERLLGMKTDDIKQVAEDIIFGQMRLIIATMDIEEINADRDKFLEAVSSNVETELKKIGLRLINVNVTDITDESGYIEALGQEAAAQAINAAKVSVAEAERGGAIGSAEAEKEKRIREAEGQAEALLKVQNAKAEGLRMLKEAGADEAVLRLKSLEAFEKAADGQATKIIIPSEIQGIAGLASSLQEIITK